MVLNDRADEQFGQGTDAREDLQLSILSEFRLLFPLQIQIRAHSMRKPTLSPQNTRNRMFMDQALSIMIVFFMNNVDDTMLSVIRDQGSTIHCQVFLPGARRSVRGPQLPQLDQQLDIESERTTDQIEESQGNTVVVAAG